MLLELRIRNFAIIEQAVLEFAPGLNVLSGETGAGKTIIMTALGLLLGMRATPDMIRADQKEAAVEGRFEVDGDGLPEEVAGSLALEDATELIIRRTITEGSRSRVWLNDSMATVQTLGRLGASLVQVFGQHEQQALLKTDSHLAMLDRYAGLEAALAQYREAYARARAHSARLSALEQRALERERRLEMARFALGELERAQLDPAEEQDLAEKRAILANATRLREAVAGAEGLIAGQDCAALDLVAGAQSAIAEAVKIDPKLAEPLELIATARVSLEESVHQLTRYAEQIEADPGRLEQIESRLQELSRLKRKYGGSIQGAIDAMERARAEVAELENVEESVAGLKAGLHTALDTAARIARELSQARHGAAAELKAEMEAELKTLGMRNAVFEIRLQPIGRGEPEMAWEDLQLGPDGIEEAEFLIAANLGQPPMALARSASGGELSRLMLGLKRLEARRRGVATLIFDEVDAGIGGAIADVVGRKLKELGRYHQILCITHLPQIASFADRHFMVEKAEENGATVSRVTQLDRGQRVEELARMLGGAQVSERFRRAARELLERAQD